MAFIISLIIIGVILLFVELFITPGFGLAGIGGLACLIGAIVKAFFHGPVWGWSVLACAMVVCTVVLILTLRAKTWKRASLNKSIDSTIGATPKEIGLSIGQEGTSITRLGPGGTAMFNNTEVEVYSRSGLVDPGTTVRISKIDGNRVFVETLL